MRNEKELRDALRKLVELGVPLASQVPEEVCRQVASALHPTETFSLRMEFDEAPEDVLEVVDRVFAAAGMCSHRIQLESPYRIVSTVTWSDAGRVKPTSVAFEIISSSESHCVATLTGLSRGEAPEQRLAEKAVNRLQDQLRRLFA